MEGLLDTALALLATHGYVIVLLWMFADQAALPIPSIPLLIAAGAVAATGQLDLGLVIAAATVGCLLGDLLWYALGRFRGQQAIGLVCKLAIEPDSCASTTRRAFTRFGPATLLIAKYLPGVQTLAPASAGFVRAPWFGFLLVDAAGALLFVLPFLLGGYYFQPELAALLDRLREVSGGLVMLVVVVLSLYGMVKAVQWTRFLRGHKLRRLTPEDLHARLQNADNRPAVIDLRQALDFELEPRSIPGALRIPLSEIERRRDEIPTRYDVVLVCT